MPDDPKSHDGSVPEEPGGEHDSAPSPSRKKRWIIAAAAAGMVIVAILGAYVFLGGHEEPGVVTIEIGGETIYHELPEILTQLASGETSSDHVKLEIVVELVESHVDVLQDSEPVIVDAIQSYLRGKSRGELAGEAGAERLRGELLIMINQRIDPAEANDILFKTFLID